MSSGLSGRCSRSCRRRDRAHPDLVAPRLEDDARRAARAPAGAAPRRPLDLERGRGAHRAGRVRRQAAGSRRGQAADRQGSGGGRGVRRRVTRAGSAALLAGALLLFLFCWALLHHGSRARVQIRDTGLYEQYGDAIAHGQVPYRDFHLEYPPGAVPVFVLPSLGREGDTLAYDRWFDRLMSLCGCLAVAGVALGLRALDSGPVRTGAALGLTAMSPLLLGTVVLSRF